MKMLAIHMKFRCGIPVVMIGETGCGKTRLLRYLCEIQDKAFKAKTLICLKVHGGINANRINSEVESAAKLAIENKGKCNYTVLFFDEVNTTEALGLIKEAICDRTLNGKPIIPEELKFAAACNPYKIHDDETIKNLQKAGLGFYLKDGEKIPKLGQLPLRKLVYRVLPLPESMYRYVYDFGTVTGKTENEYIEKIVNNQLSGCKFITSEHKAIQILVKSVLCECQAFMREQKNECKYVSLRDVVRAMILLKWFLEKMCTVNIIKKKLTEQILNDKTINQDTYQELNEITRALIYSVSVCYYVRLTDREPFIERIVKCFTNEYELPGETNQKKISFFANEINRIQNVFLNAMTIPSNIAHNAALRENIFMMIVCIENRLPLFIVGKPGSSKSLAKSIVSNSMQGRYSSNELLQRLKQVQIFPYQCNQFSTTKSLIDVFEEAMNFQKSQDATKFASVVVLEEIGLAEDAPGLPLKVLHPYLEDGTSGADPYAMDIKPDERVAFIGISNWALDPAKMNRGIMVVRCSPEPQELTESACGIANMVTDVNLRSELTISFDMLAKMYQKICLKQEECETMEKDEAREFFGLRDFYTMIKMICWKCIDIKAPPSPRDYRRIVLRNFSGHTKINPLEELPNPDLLIEMEGTENESLEIVKESVQPLEIKDVNVTLPKQENRYLLYITENQSALQILQYKLLPKKEKLFVFYGSSFPKDTEYTQVCVNINKIKVFMEKGIPVVLLNYEQIYESLYDVLNQCYTELPTGRYVDLGLRSYRIKCRVDPNFRLIIIAERDRVFKQFPAALINRLEKHFVASSTILTPQQKALAMKIRKWVNEFANIEHNGKRYCVSDSFIGFQEDTPSSVVLHVSNTKEQDQQIYDDSIALLLQTASIDAVTRLKSSSSKCSPDTKDKAFRIFFEEQQHFSMMNFLSNVIEDFENNGAMIQITTFGPLLTQNYIVTLKQELTINSIKLFQLSDFDTEMDFCNEIKAFYALNHKKKLLIVQCEYGDKKTDLIACARHRLMDEGQRITISGPGITCAVFTIFIIQLPRVAGGTSFASFQGGSWICTHIDELTCHSGVKEILQSAISKPLHKFFHMLIEKKDEVPDEFNVSKRIRDIVQVSVSMIISIGTYKQMECLIGLLLQLISNDFSTEDVSDNFTSCLLLRIGDLLQQRDYLILHPNNWAIDAAMDRSKLQASFTLVNSIKKAIDTQLQPILAYIISCINKNNNLILLKSENKCLKKLWTSLFSSLSFLPFDYGTIVTTTIQAINIKGRSYNCKFPFSWEIIDQVNAAFVTVGHNDGNKKKAFQDLVESTRNQAFVKHIEKLPSDDALIFYDCYLHDFVNNLVLPFSEEAIESVHEILFEVLRQIVIKFEPLAATREHFPLINVITAIHLAYSIIEQEIFWLAELSEGFPKLPCQIKDKQLLSSGKTVFHFKAVECVIDKIWPEKPEWKDDESVNYLILNFHSSKSAVETILYLKGHDDMSNKVLFNLRSRWQGLMSIVLFAEHVIAPFMPNVTLTTSKFTFLKRFSNVVKVVKEPSSTCMFSEPKILKQSIRQIQAVLIALPVQEQANCQLCKSVLKITEIIYVPCDQSHMFCEKCFNDSIEKRGPRCPSCDTPIPRKRAKDFCIPDYKKKEYEQLKQVQQYCLDFFMELVSQCCFSPITPTKPTDDFYKELLTIVTDIEHKDYKNLFPIEENYTHGCPIARSVLLQLLLEHNPKEVQIKLQEYQNYIKRTFGSEYITDDKELTLLCIKSLEDGLHKSRTKKECLDDELQFGIKCLNGALALLRDGDHFRACQDNLSVEFMQCIANVRFGICFAVDIFYHYYCFGSDERNQLPRVTKEKLQELCKSIHGIIGKGVLKEPYKFFIKQFVRQFGFPYLSELGKLKQFEWLDLKKTETFDGFIVCGKEYTTLRAKWIFTADLLTEDDLVNDLEEHDSKSVLNKVASTLVYYRHIESNTSNATALGQKDLFFTHQKVQKLLSHVFNGGPGSLVTGVIFNPREPKTTDIAAVVVHWISVLETRIDNSLFGPFKEILHQTANSKEMYWPTMDDDILDIVVDATAGTTDTQWKCPNGHTYFVQNCGRQVVGDVKKCFCGAEIGGKSYNVPKEGNIKVKDSTELTKKGHTLGNPNSRTTDPLPQRDLSPLSNCIIRLLINATCVWIASSINEAACKALQDVTSDLTTNAKPMELCWLLNYFWHHLEVDIQTLCRATQYSFDDCILFLHIIVHNMLIANLETNIDFDSKLCSRKDRKSWEIKFNQIVIKPNIEVQTERGKEYLIGKHIERGRQLIIEDSDLDHRKLLEMIYETVPVISKSIMPHLWIYRPLITIDHVSLSLENDTRSADLNVLRQFLKQVKLLEALTCLPDIIRLQQFLYEMCHLRIDKTEVDQPFNEFIRKGFIRTHRQKKLLAQAESFCTAWNSVKNELLSLSRKAYCIHCLL
ncbi:PREDICTED: E3 ubiquitin-protein ligase rnf213-alpha-like [Amphimedon queenslandica]|uniref:RING-type domain-containing protein n=1 Tax=Amphimedon queenslandica TaxID=400682 RepID=A0AAN0JI16_AMPQE|nr:PREDICTED: E3 ubiquitin-protein ligase rnf213-alpha-like [Amphimedon queenslandica]|eukprot:XP_019856417.1 PREDICTED: E3 ubiquitin-protein ligase rnf213-alpha-like [Amphimedon queenslandica]